MSAKLTYRRLMELRKAEPFQPFTVVTKDGARYPVERWHHLGTNGDLLLITNDDDRIAHLTVADVQSIEPTVVAAGR